MIKLAVCEIKSMYIQPLSEEKEERQRYGKRCSKSIVKNILKIYKNIFIVVLHAKKENFTLDSMMLNEK